ncbi:thioredoxin [Adlercreutzia murintestinalis]|jgi:thioredoxin|uniref:thioredoxin n=1 Tax=Adlercreutzia murintestinalis TaxID=2941325 RepID=UPI00203D9860|nr:thioredoxin [Adlercreutzia murintestinalis]
MSQVVTSADFDTKVLQADKPVLVDFFATWCGPCKRLAPVIDELSDELAGKVDVCKVDIDQSPDIAARYKVSSVPTIMLFEGGALKNKTVGAVPKQQLLQML